MDNAGSSEDELPPAFQYESPSDNKVKAEDIVWAKYRKAFWPAVVRRVYNHLKKASVMYVDAPHATTRIRLPMRSIVPFNSKKGLELQKQHVDASIKTEFSKSVSKVDDFLCKRIVRGMTTSPIKYFQSPFGICDDDASEEEEESSDEIEDEGGDDQVPNTENNEKENSDVEVPNTESDDNETEEQFLNVSINKSSSEVDDDTSDQTSQCDIETINELLNLIRSEPCQLHLQQILNEQINCERHKKFLSVTPSVRRQLKWQSGFGPISDEQQMTDLCSYLMNNLKFLTAKRDHFDVTTYLFDVWIPQAIIWALSQFHHISFNEAEEMFIGQRNI